MSRLIKITLISFFVFIYFGFSNVTEAIVGIDRNFPLAVGEGVVNPAHIYVVRKQSDEKIILGGFFYSYDSVSQASMVRLFPNGDVDNSFEAGSSKNVIDMAVLADDSIVIAGEFCCVSDNNDNIVTPNFAKFNADGSVDTSFVSRLGMTTVQKQQYLWALAVQPDGNMLIGGESFQYQGVPSFRIARVLPNALRDPTFTSGFSTGNGYVYEITLQDDGKILVGGDIFETYNGTPIAGLVRLHSDGSLDTDFVSNLGTGFDSEIYAITIQDDGKILVGGKFNTFNGQPAYKLVRLNSDGTRDSSFVGGCNIGAVTFTQYVRTIKIDSADNIYVGGSFTSCSGVTASNIARLTSSGAMDPTFPITPPSINKPVWDIFIEQLDSVIGVGSFDFYGSFIVNRIARFIIDVVPPVITYETPETYSGSPIPVTIAIQDDSTGSGIASTSNVSIVSSIDGVLPKTCTGIPTLSSLPATCTVTLYSAGNHVLTTTLTDASTNVTSEVSPTYGIDTSNPVVTINSPTKVYAGDITDTTITITDDSGLNDVVITGGSFTCSASFPTPDTSVTCTGVITNSGDVAVEATDRSGNFIQQTETGFIIDTEAPIITVLDPNFGTYSTSQTISFEVTDNRVFPVEGITVTGPESYTVTCAEGREFSYQCSFISNLANNNITIQAVDALGNNATPQTLLYVIDIVAPQLVSISSTNPSGSYVAGDSINITAVYDKALGLDNSISLQLNNGASVVLSVISGTTASGEYVISNGEDIELLDVATIISQLITNTSGAELLSTTIPAGGNLADSRSILIDTIRPTVISDTTSFGLWTVVFSEPVVSVGNLSDDFDLTVETLVNSIQSISIMGSTMSINAGSIRVNNTLSLQYDPTTTQITDLAGNAAIAFNLSQSESIISDGGLGGGSSSGSLIRGCTDPTALNYDVRAGLLEPGSCMYPIFGCTNIDAENYSPLANENDGSCLFEEVEVPLYVAGDAISIPLVTSVAESAPVIESEPIVAISEAVKTTFDAFVDLVSAIDMPLIPNIVIPLLPEIIFPDSENISMSDIAAFASLLATLFLLLYYLGLSPKTIVSAFGGSWVDSKKDTWGVVFDSVTNKPISDVGVSLYNETGKMVASMITNTSGTFQFAVTEGVYRLEVHRKLYKFPSQVTFFEKFTDTYHGEMFTLIKTQVPKINIPLDPEDGVSSLVSQNTRHKNHREVRTFFLQMVNVLYWAGFVLSVFSFLLFSSIYNAVILGLYLVTLYVKIKGKRA